jgi:hypothetical protein
MQDEYRVRARVAEDGKLTLENLPFSAGEEVKVTVSRASADNSRPLGGSLKGNLTHYEEPM